MCGGKTSVWCAKPKKPAVLARSLRLSSHSTVHALAIHSTLHILWPLRYALTPALTPARIPGIRTKVKVTTTNTLVFESQQQQQQSGWMIPMYE